MIFKAFTNINKFIEYDLQGKFLSSTFNVTNYGTIKWISTVIKFVGCLYGTKLSTVGTLSTVFHLVRLLESISEFRIEIPVDEICCLWGSGFKLCEL